MNQDQDANGQNKNHIPGYEPVLMQSAAKQRLREFRFTCLPDISKRYHVERLLITAAIELVLKDEGSEIQKQWLEIFQEIARKDFGEGMNSLGIV